MTNKDLIKQQIKNCIYNLLRINNQVPEIDKIILITKRLQPEHLNRKESKKINCKSIKVVPTLYEDVYKWVKEKLNQLKIGMQEIGISEDRIVRDKKASIGKIKDVLDWCKKVESLTEYKEGEIISQDVQHLSEGLENIGVTIQKFITGEESRLFEFLKEYQD